MKQLLVGFTLGLFALLVIGASYRNTDASEVITKKACHGYTVIEASLGIDCNGDTLRLQKVNGYYERLPDDRPGSTVMTN